MNEICAPAFSLFSKASGKPFERLFPLHFRFGIDKIGQGFNLRQIEPPIRQSAPREFTSLRRSKPRDVL